MQDDHLSQEDATLYRAALHEIIALATDLARRIHAEATAPEPSLTLEQASIALDRTARTLRRTILLARRLHQLPPGQHRTAARRQLIRGVEDAIHRAARATPDHQDALRAEFQERLDRPDLEADLATRPIPELIEELARDLGVAIQGRSWVFPRRTPADIEQLAACALRRPGAPRPKKDGTEGPLQSGEGWVGVHRNTRASPPEHQRDHRADFSPAHAKP